MSFAKSSHSCLLILFLSSLNVQYHGVLGDDRVRYDWYNATTLQSTRGYDIVVQDGPNMNLNLCTFDPTDLRYVNCLSPIPLTTTISTINPYGISAGGTTGTYYGIWLQSQRGTWEDKVFGQQGTVFSPSSIIRIDDHQLMPNNDFYMYLQPESQVFTTVTMRLYLTCDNGTTYVGGELDLSSFMSSGTRATYQNSVYSLINGCHQACAEIYIQGIQRNTNYPHKFRAGSICGSLQDGAVSVVANTVGLVTMLAILVFTAYV